MRTEQGPWAAFEPTEQDPWDASKVAHLHRRAGFGATRAEIARDVKDGPKASVDRFFQPRPLTTGFPGFCRIAHQHSIERHPVCRHPKSRLRSLRLEGAQAGAQSCVEGSQERLADRHADPESLGDPAAACAPQLRPRHLGPARSRRPTPRRAASTT